MISVSRGTLWRLLSSFEASGNGYFWRQNTELDGPVCDPEEQPEVFYFLVQWVWHTGAENIHLQVPWMLLSPWCHSNQCQLQRGPSATFTSGRWTIFVALCKGSGDHRGYLWRDLYLGLGVVRKVPEKDEWAKQCLKIWIIQTNWTPLFSQSHLIYTSVITWSYSWLTPA